MPNRTALLLGCGSIGSEVAKLLAADDDFSHLVVGDRDGERAASLAESLGSRASSLRVDLEDSEALRGAVSVASVVLNASGPFTRTTFQVIRTAAEAGVPYADVNDEAELLWELFEKGEVDALARQHGVPVVAGLGASPGHSNIVARYLADQMDEVLEVHFFLVADTRYRSQAVWRHRFSIFGGSALTYSDGQWIRLPAMSEAEDVRFPAPWGTVRCYAVGLESLTLPRFIKGLRHTSMKRGFLHPVMAQPLQDFIRYGLTSDTPMRVGEAVVSPAEFSAAFLSDSATDQLFDFGPPQTGPPRQVRVVGRKGARPLRLTLTYAHTAQTIALATASCLAVGGRLLALGQVPGPGLLAPEALDPAPFLRDMEFHGVTLHLMQEEDIDRFP